MAAPPALACIVPIRASGSLRNVRRGPDLLCLARDKLSSSLLCYFDSNQASISNDIMLLENQIPWAVIETLRRFKEVPVEEFVAKMGRTFQVRKEKEREEFDLGDGYKPPHLLGLLRFYKTRHTLQVPKKNEQKLPALGSSSASQVPTSDQDRQISMSKSISAIELAEIGIKLMASKTTKLVDMGMEKTPLSGNIFLAPLLLDDIRSCWLVNMAALEVCLATGVRDDEEPVVCSYLALLAMLMDREEDVHKLRSKRLVQGELTNKETLDFFKTLIKHISGGSLYIRILEEIEDYKLKRRIWIKIYEYVYQNKKAIVTVLSLIGVLAGIFKALLSVKHGQQFDRLPLLTHLNLSHLGFQGQIPTGIGGLINLISLDLSANYDLGDVYTYDDGTDVLYLQVPNFQILVANLNNLTELYLDGVDMSSSADWCHALAKYLPRLQVLSLSYCNLVGPICPSLSNLHSLTVINLQDNFDMHGSPFPELFMDFHNLSVLQLAGTNLQGPIPSSIGKLVNLRSLEIFGVYKDIGPIPSSIGKLVNLRSLEIFGVYKDIGPMPSAVGNLSNLESLEINDSEFSGPIPYAVGLLKKLTSLHIRNSGFSGSIPNSVSNLTRLIVLDLSLNDLKGELPVSVFTIPTLQHLDICSSQTFGSIQDINATSSHLLQWADTALSNRRWFH
ncbi:hypothetical protein ZWY2020_031604 [Hordeum vulgare]|nr:hypothetical protein ZWY2020_031604 [Hordeum vulgare]